MSECSCLFVSLSSQASGPRIGDQDQPGGVRQGSSLPASPVLYLLSLSASLLSALLLSLSFCGRRNGWHYSTPTPTGRERVRVLCASVSVGVSAGWPSVSRPDGRVTLAAWRGLICAR